VKCAACNGVGWVAVKETQEDRQEAIHAAKIAGKWDRAAMLSNIGLATKILPCWACGGAKEVPE